VTSPRSHRAAVRAYYQQTWRDFRGFWLDEWTLAQHFGYWDKHTRGHSDSLLQMNRAMAKRVDWTRCESVLDAGCGVGGTAIWLAEKFSVHVTGISIVPAQLTLAKRFANHRGVSHLVTFQHSDYLRTGFPDARFDVVWAQESFCHALDKPAFLAEASRVLKPGGFLVVADYVRSAARFSRRDKRVLDSWLSGWQIPNLPMTEQITAWLNTAGFENTRIDNVTPFVRRSSRRLHNLAMDLFSFAVLLHAFGLRTDIQHGNICGARFQWTALQRGLWYYAIMSAKTRHGGPRALDPGVPDLTLAASSPRPDYGRGGGVLHKEHTSTQETPSRRRADQLPPGAQSTPKMA
jgi:tocopherol O-methyltransferase